MNKRIEYIKETLMECVESQMRNLEEVDTKELGEVIDMLKDLEELSYYCAVTKAMEDYTLLEDSEGRMYYNNNGGKKHVSNNSSSNSSYPHSNGNGRREWER